MEADDMTVPRPQRSISNDVLAERIANFYENNRTEFSAIHHHLAEVATKLDKYDDSLTILRDSVRDHAALQHHQGTRDELVRIGSTQLEMERALGGIRLEIAEIKRQIRDEQNIKKGRLEALSILDKVYLGVLAAIPSLLLIYDTFLS